MSKVLKSRKSLFTISLTAVLVISFLTSICFAQVESKTQAMRQKAAWTMRIASEQYHRGLYKEAEYSLVKIENAYSSYMTSEDVELVSELLMKVRLALSERVKVADFLRQSDEYSVSGQYLEARSSLETALASRFLSEAEREQINTILSDLGQKIAAAPQAASVSVASKENQRVAELFNLSIKLYNTGQYFRARSGFVEVSQSGLNITADGFSANDYIATIDGVQVDRAEPSAENLFDSAMWDSPESMLVEDSQPIVTESVALDPIATDVSVSSGDDGYIRQIEQKRNRQINYTRAIVSDAVLKAENFTLQKEFDKADQALARAFTTINKNKMLLGDDLYSQFDNQLKAIESNISVRRSQHHAAIAEQTRLETEQLRQNIRQTTEERRSQAVIDYMGRAYAFQEQQRYEEALGQLEQVLVVDPTNQAALILSQTLEDTVRWRQQLEIQKINDDQELALLIDADRKKITRFNEMNFYGAGDVAQPKNWKELIAGRKEEDVAGRNKADVLVYKQLDQIVDLSELTEDTPFNEAIDIVSNAASPPLTIVVMEGDLSENAFIEQDEPIKMSGRGLSAVRMKTGLERLLLAVGGGLADLGYVVEDGIITIATEESLPTNYENMIYDVSELLGAPAEFAFDTQDIGNSGGGGGSGGSGGSSRGGSSSSGGSGGSSRSSGGSSRSGGGSSSRGGGSSGGGSSSRGGGSSGGSGGSGGGDLTGQYLTEERAYDIIYIIQQTIDPDTWFEVGGEGQIFTFGGSKLIVWQTPEIQEKIRTFLNTMRGLLGQQIAIESRFLLVDENFMEDIGFDVDILQLGLGSSWGADGLVNNLLQSSFNIAAPSASSITSSLGGVGAFNSTTQLGDGTGIGAAFQTELLYSGNHIADDLSVNFLIRATQAHANSKTLTAPKVTVMSGESAVIRVQKERAYVSNISLSSDTQTTAGDDVAFAVTYFVPEISILQTGIVMNVTPTVTNDKKYVILRITTSLQEELDSGTRSTFTGVLGSGAETVGWEEPVIEYTDIMTRVVVPDRGTLMLGGLTLTAEREIEAGVPVLSKIPILGRLFSNRSEVKDKQILLVLVKPTIVLKEENEEAAIAAMQ